MARLGSINNVNFDVSGLQEQAKRRGTVIVLFAEGTATNGRGLLQMPSIRCDSILHVIGLSYTSTNVQCPIATDAVSFIFRATSGLSPLGLLASPTECRTTQLRPSSVPPPQTVFSTMWTEEVRTAMAKAVGSRDKSVVFSALQTGSLVEKAAFVEHWNTTMSH
jgi:hypothetical protein